MSTYETRVRVGADGRVVLTLPSELVNLEVDVSVSTHSGSAAGPITADQRNAIMEWLATHGEDDPSFVRQPQAEREEREPLD